MTDYQPVDAPTSPAPVDRGTREAPGGGAGDKPSLWYRLRTMNGRLLFGSILVIFIAVLAIFAPFFATHDPLSVDMPNRLAPPSADNWFGTDANGRDVYSRIVHGSRVSLSVGAAVVILSTVFGTFIGLVSGFYRWLDGILMRIMDALMAFPAILLAIAIIAALGASARNVVIALTATYTPRTARVVRGKVLSVREEMYVESARAIGLRNPRIIARYIFPNVLAPLMVQATFILALAIIAEAGLSYIGAGTPPPAPSWGNILADGRAFLANGPWMTTFPGIFIMISVLGLNIMGDGIRDVLDPRLKDNR